MGQILSITGGLPFCQNTKGEEINLSIGLRVSIVALGTLALIVGILIVVGIPGLSQLGTTIGYGGLSAGALVALAGISVKCIKQPSPAEIKPYRPEEKSEEPRQKEIVIGEASTVTTSIPAKEKLEEPSKTLEEAIIKGSLLEVIQFIETGASLTELQEGEDKVTALHLAAKYDKEGQIIEELIRRGLDVNQPIEYHLKGYDHVVGSRLTPLHYAAFFNSSKIVQLLIDRGANIDARCECLQTPLHVAVRSYQNNVDEQLKIIDCLKNAEVNARTCHGETPLLEACYRGNLQVFERLIELGVDPNINANFNLTVLHCAVMAENVSTKILTRLIDDFKFDVNSLTDNSAYGEQTPLDLVSPPTKNHEEVAKLLIAKGGKYKKRNLEPHL
jgi:ankyrin repeat protein